MRYLDHPGVMQLHRVYEDENFIHLVMTYTYGGELYTRIIKRGKFSEKTAAKFIQNLLHTLDYFDSNGVVHRDIKPENILLKNPEDDTEFLLADFGLATFASGSNLNLRCGSPGYLAPEILAKEMYGSKVDVYSAGVILYILLSGISPFPGREMEEILSKNKEGSIYFHP